MTPVMWLVIFVILLGIEIATKKDKETKNEG